jgi:hypothetical protein
MKAKKKKKAAKEPKYVEMMVDDWDRKFKPVTNYGGDAGAEGQEFYETFGSEYAEVLKAHKKDPRTVWTRLDADGTDVIANGLHWVNRVAYYITKVPAAKNTNYDVHFDPIRE